MNNTKLVYWFSLIILGCFFYSCKVQEKENVKVKIKVKPRSPKFLVKKLHDKEFHFETISAKASTTFDNGKKTAFKTHLRIRKDSAIWLSITPMLGIEMARVVITKDTVKFMNRKDNEYFIGDFEYINTLFGADLDYQMLEALLIGNSLDFEKNNRIHSSVDRKKDRYFLSTEKKRKIKKELKKEKDKLKKQSLVLWLDPMTFKINEILLSSPHNKRSLSGIYTNYQEVETQLIPYNLRFNLKSKTSSNIEIEYSKFSMGKSLTFPFKIPSKYVQVKK
jgi:hypothetical protein